MATARDDGGRAFPEVTTDWHPDSESYRVGSEGGMTLRDYFAAKAMQSLTADATCHDVLSASERIAMTAYTMADTMLKARAQ